MANIRLPEMDFLYSALLFLTFCLPYVLSQCDNELSIPLGLETFRMKFPSDNKTVYGTFLLCEWRFVTDSPEKGIVYQLSNIGIDCGDTLLVYTDTPDYDKGICCTNCNKDALMTPGALLKMSLNSDGTTNAHESGFTLDLIAAKGFETCPTQPIQVTSEKQQIASPQFPGQYLANLNCKIELTAPSGVTLRFEYIDVETHTECHKSCCDVIHIYEGTIKPGNEPISSICDKNNFKPDLMFESTGTTLTLQLVTDDQVPRRGFVAIVQAKEGNSTLVTVTPEVTDATVPLITEPSHDVFETLTYSRFELRCDIPTLENGIDITWTKDGSPFRPVLDSSRVYFMEDKSLVIFTSILKEDGGLYVCEADSPFHPTYTGRIIVKDRGLNCDQNTCLNGGTCFETTNSYRCECVPGYEGTRCEKDIDECQELNICNNGSCINTQGSYNCDCQALSGWTGDFCDVDVNECEVNQSLCAPHGVCVNTKGGFVCQCNDGWMGFHCQKDIDECESMTSVCSGNGRCSNRPGSFSCECNAGWKGPMCSVKDESSCIHIPCKHNGSCLLDDTTKKYHCVCAEGFEGEYCQKDIDECKTMKTVCSGNGRCLNEPGSFSCVCNVGWKGPRCSVKVEPSCIQIPCKHNGSCLMDDTTKKYRCVCAKGFEGEYCQQDIDECNTIKSVCSGNGRCLNEPGSFSCVCNAGWKGPRCSVKVEPSCIQIPCKHNGSCLLDDISNKYHCVCAEGFEGEYCQKDIDECKTITATCSGNGRCINRPGGFSCVCDSGWEGSRCSIKVKPSCIQIPCKDGGSCILNDTTNSYRCVCADGFEGEFCGKDINECVTLWRPCSGRGKCVNSYGSYFCRCFADWEGKKCEKRIDPCLSNPCPNKSVCNMKGYSYKCTCLIGWEGPNCDQGPCAVKCEGQESCYMEHNCTHYEHCYAWNAAQCHCTLMICSFGTFWNSKINTCDRVPKVLCKSDPCLTLGFQATYPSNFNCRTFYMCNKNKQSLAMCCAKGYSYDHKHQGCKPSPHCNLECSEQPKTITTVAPSPTSVPLEMCYFRAINGRPEKYYNTISRIQQDCPLGTVFKSMYCVCVEDVTFTSRLCVPLVYVDFAGDDIRNLYRQNYIEVKNVFQVQFRNVKVFYGLFNETSSSIQVPRLSTVALSRLMIQLRFFSSKSIGPRYQNLVSNCHSSAKPWDIPQLARGQTPSLAIVADTVDKHLTFLGYSDDWRARPAIFALPYKDNAWNNVELTFNGNSLRGRIRSQNPNNTTFESKDEKPLSGRIAASFGPLILGRCSDNDAFSGYMDMVKVYDCIPAP